MKDNFGIAAIEPSDPLFPQLLRDIPSPPKILYCKGAVHSFHVPAVAIVGTRRASLYGKERAHAFAFGLAANGIGIVSGLALGIDAAAHRGAIEAGGLTWAVLAHGLDTVSPSANAPLARTIIEKGGSLVSEYPTRTPAYPNQFILRNRIISGLASAVVIIEAPEESGALATARFALAQKKPVLVVPGPASCPNFRGSHRLIRDGARLVRNTEDILSDLNIRPMRTTKADYSRTHSPTEQKIIEALSLAPYSLSVDKIVQITTLKPQEVSAALSRFIFEGIAAEEGGAYRIIDHQPAKPKIGTGRRK